MMAAVRPVGIAGLGRYVPERLLTNQDLEKMVDTSDEWIVQRTGIRERRIAAKDEVTSTLALHASRQALEHAGLAAEDLELVICATVTGDQPFPATACRIGHDLGAKDAGGFDLASLNIQRGRDHGLPSYNDTRRALLMPPARGFGDITRDRDVRASLEAAYDDVEQVDLWVGGLAEDAIGMALDLVERVFVEQVVIGDAPGDVSRGRRLGRRTAFPSAAAAAARATLGRRWYRHASTPDLPLDPVPSRFP